MKREEKTEKHSGGLAKVAEEKQETPGQCGKTYSWSAIYMTSFNGRLETGRANAV